MDSLSKIDEPSELDLSDHKEKGSFAKIVQEGIKDRKLNADIKFDTGRSKLRTSSIGVNKPKQTVKSKRVQLRPKSQYKTKPSSLKRHLKPTESLPSLRQKRDFIKRKTGTGGGREPQMLFTNRLPKGLDKVSKGIQNADFRSKTARGTQKGGFKDYPISLTRKINPSITPFRPGKGKSISDCLTMT